jgi:hypothetical protein
MPPAPFAWDRSQTLAMAWSGCRKCHGWGLTPGRGGGETPCNCVLRAIFRACYRRYLLSRSAAASLTSQTSVEYMEHGRDSHRAYGRKAEEYSADFDLVSRRTLDPVEYGVFRLRYLSHRQWADCCRRLRLDRGTYFHIIYRIERKLGRAFRELEPFSLFPLDEYFGGTVERRAA